jgi:hypothetical protein
VPAKSGENEYAHEGGGAYRVLRELHASRRQLRHGDHVRVVWLYLRCYSVLETLARFSAGLKRFATANGKANLYHETITWAYVFLINERMERSGREQGWAEFVDSNADLFDWKDSILKSYYQHDTLRSEVARKVFVFPDKPGAHSSA